MKNRIKAFAAHLCLSILLFGAPLAAATMHFYPGVFFDGDGGLEVIKIALCVDLVLGPLLTMCVFIPGKKGLKLDLALISLLQCVAFGYGVYAMYSNRPVAIVFGGDFLHSITQPQLVGQTVELPLGGSPLPVYAVVKPVGLKERSEFAAKALRAGRPFHALADSWVGVDNAKAKSQMELANFMEAPSKLMTDKAREVAQRLAAAYSSSPGKKLFIMQLRYNNALVVLDEASKQIVAWELVDVGDLLGYTLTQGLDLK